VSLDEDRGSSTGTIVEAPADMHGRVELHLLSIRDFRNLRRVELRPPRGGMAIIGDNGHGKTNLLEAIYYMQLLRSARGARDQELVRFGERVFHLRAELTLNGRERTVSVGFDRQEKRKKVMVDGVEATRLSDALGALPAVLFSPRDTSLVSGAPSERRRFLDVVLSLTSRRYLQALQRYRGALARRNAALRDAQRQPGGEERAAVWEPALAEYGAVLWSERVAWVERWSPVLSSLCDAIGERAPVTLRYSSQLAPAGAVADALRGALESRRQFDIRRGITHSGPHRDDLELRLDERELRLFGSAGQQRTAALALRMLEARTLREAVGAAPLLLLDDPFAELDGRRAARILTLLEDAGVGQTLLAVPREDDIPPALTGLARMRISDGEVRPHDHEDGSGANDERPDDPQARS